MKLVLAGITVSLLILGWPSYNCRAQGTSGREHLREMIGAGEYSEAIVFAQQLLAKDTSQLDILDFEVEAGICADHPESYLKAALEYRGSDPLSLCRKGLCLLRIGHTSEAAPIFAQLDSIGWNRSWAEFWLGKIADIAGDDSIAIAFYKNAEENPACRTSALMAEARLRTERGELDISESLNRQCVADPVYKTRALCRLAHVEGLRGKWDAALKSLEDLTVTRADAESFEYLSWAYLHLGNISKSQEVTDRALEKWPSNQELLCRKIDLAREYGNDSLAMAISGRLDPIQLAHFWSTPALDIAIELQDTLRVQEEATRLLTVVDDDPQILYRYLRWLDHRNRTPEADGLFAGISKISSPQYELLVRASRVSVLSPMEAYEITEESGRDWHRLDNLAYSRIYWLSEAGNDSAAESMGRSYLTKAPGETYLLHLLARSAYGAMKYDEALDWLDRIDRLAPGNLAAQELRIRTLIDKGELVDASALIDSLLPLYPLREDLLNNALALYFKTDNKLQLAKAISADVLQNVQGPNSIVAVTKILGVLERYGAADTLLTGAIAKYPAAAELHFERGMSLYYAGKPQEAQEELATAQRLDPFESRYSKGLAVVTAEAKPLDQYNAETKPDTSWSMILASDSIVAMARASMTEPGDFGAVVLLARDEWRIDNLLARKRIVQKIVKLADARAPRHYGNVSLDYNAWYETPHLIVARTIHDDGEVFSLSPDQVMITAPDEASASDVRAVYFNYPKVEMGAILEYIIEFESTMQDRYELSESQLLANIDPVDKSIFKLTAPLSWKINRRESPRVSFTQNDSADSRQYVWSATNLAPFKWETDCANPWSDNYWVAFAYARTWKDDVASYSKIVAPKIDTLGQVAKLAHEMTRNCSTNAEKIAALFRYVSKEVRYVAVNFGDGGKVPEPATEVLENRYGDCKDKTILFLSLLRSEGITAYPALVSSRDTVNFARSVPNLDQFDHMITCLPGRKPVFLDPTCEQCQPYELSLSYRGKPALVIDPSLDQPLILTPPATAYDNRLVRRARLAVRPDGGALIDVDMSVTGPTAFAILSRLSALDTADLRGFVEQQTKVGFWEESHLTNYSIVSSPDSGLWYGWHAQLVSDSNFARKELYAYVPVNMNMVKSMLDLPDTTRRELAFDAEELCYVDEELTIVPGKEWELFDGRISWTLDTTWFKATSQSTTADDSLSIHNTFTLKQRIIPVDQLRSLTRAIKYMQAKAAWDAAVYRRLPDQDKVVGLTKALEERPADVSLAVGLADEVLASDWGGSSCQGIERRAFVLPFLERAYNADPGNELLMYRIVVLQTENKQFLRADSLLNAYLANHPKSVYADVLRSALYMSLNRLDDLLAIMEEILRSAPSDKLRAALVEAYSKKGEFEKAEEQLGTLRTLKADTAVIVGTAFTIAVAKEEWEKAESLLTQMPDTSDLLIYGYRYKIYEARDDYRGMLEATRLLTEKHPDSPLLLNNEAWALAMLNRDLKTALAKIETALSLKGECEPNLRNTRGVVLMLMGKIEDAVADFTACLQDQSAESLTANYYFLGECARIKRQNVRAKDYYSKAIAANGDEKYVERAKAKRAEIQ